jgi:hypothetical protein
MTPVIGVRRWFCQRYRCHEVVTLSGAGGAVVVAGDGAGLAGAAGDGDDVVVVDVGSTAESAGPDGRTYEPQKRRTRGRS